MSIPVDLESIVTNVYEYALQTIRALALDQAHNTKRFGCNMLHPTIGNLRLMTEDNKNNTCAQHYLDLIRLYSNKLAELADTGGCTAATYIYVMLILREEIAYIHTTGTRVGAKQLSDANHELSGITNHPSYGTVTELRNALKI